jgi:serine/threonine protein kinase
MIDEGSTSKVFLAHELNDPTKQVAIKILKAEFLMSTEISPPPIEQNNREIQILSSLDHPNINKIIEHGH